MSQDQAVKVGMPMHLICKTVEAVDECLWSWRPSELEQEIPVRKIEPFGEQRLNCDIRFDHVLPHHDGIWTCGAKFHSDTNFSRAPPMRITIRTGKAFRIKSCLIRLVPTVSPLVAQCMHYDGGLDSNRSQTFNVIMHLVLIFIYLQNKCGKEH